jgi:4-amino-4-deoxy-L-arabinose transferase-like glycosyltransferase
LSLIRWVAIGWVVVFWRLGYLSLLDPDEAHYAEVTRELVQQGGWLVPLLDGKPFIDKPVLFHWLQGLSVLLLGETEFASRLPSAIAALALFGMTRWVGTVLFGATVGEWGAIMFATIPATFALSSIATLDMVFSTFLFGALGSLLVASTQQRPRLEWVGYGLLTLAVLTKGPVALVLVGLFVITARLVPGDARAQVKTLHWKTGLLAVAIAASPWFLWMSWRFGMEFIRGYTVAGNLWYFTQPAQFSGRIIRHTFYARTFAGAFFPWSIIVVGRAIDVIRGLRIGRSINSGETLLWLWVLVVIGFFTVARFKLDHYIFPAAPACCLLAAHAWRLAAEDADGWLRGTRFSILAIAAVLILAGSFGSVILFELDVELPRIAIAFPLALAAGGIVMTVQAARRQWAVASNAAVAVTTLLTAYAIVVAVGFPAFQRTRPTAHVANRLKRLAAVSAPVGIYRVDRWRASLRYYIGRPVQQLESPEEVRAFLSQPQPAYAVMFLHDYLDLRRHGAPIHLVIERRAVVSTRGRGVRRQRWGHLVVATNVPSDYRSPRNRYPSPD